MKNWESTPHCCKKADPLKNIYVSVYIYISENQNIISRKIAYGHALAAFALPVIIQKMLLCDKSGVLFSRNPVSGQNQRYYFDKSRVFLRRILIKAADSFVAKGLLTNPQDIIDEIQDALKYKNMQQSMVYYPVKIQYDHL